MLGFGLFMLMLVFIDPCLGRLTYPIDGRCSNGDSFANPLMTFVVGSICMLPIALIALSSTENDTSFELGKVTITQNVFRYFQRWPKWRKKWYPVFFVVVYGLIATFFYISDRNGGLRWYHYVGEFVIVGPFLASIFAFSLASWARKKFKIK